MIRRVLFEYVRSRSAARAAPPEKSQSYGPEAADGWHGLLMEDIAPTPTRSGGLWKLTGSSPWRIPGFLWSAAGFTSTTAGRRTGKLETRIPHGGGSETVPACERTRACHMIVYHRDCASRRLKQSDRPVNLRTLEGSDRHRKCNLPNVNATCEIKGRRTPSHEHAMPSQCALNSGTAAASVTPGQQIDPPSAIKFESNGSVIRNSAEHRLEQSDASRPSQPFAVQLRYQRTNMPASPETREVFMHRNRWPRSSQCRLPGRWFVSCPTSWNPHHL